jgi:hypothetical protein
MTSVHYQSNVSLDKVDIHPFEMEWEKAFKWNTFGPLLADTFPIAVVLAVLYVILVFAGQRWMRDRKGKRQNQRNKLSKSLSPNTKCHRIAHPSFALLSLSLYTIHYYNGMHGHIKRSHLVTWVW